MIKLSPKGAKFCPGCPKKDLQLKAMPTLVITVEQKKDTKIVTLTNNREKVSAGGLF